MKSTWRELWDSGELRRIAEGCQSQKDLAHRLGVSKMSLESALRRLREQGVPVPPLPELCGYPRGPNMRASGTPLVVDQWDEPTHPGVPDLGIPVPDLGSGDPRGMAPGMELSGDPEEDRSLLDPVEHPPTSPEGHRIKGLSTYYNAEGKPVAQWVKTTATASDVDLLLAAMKGITEPFRGSFPPVPKAAEFADDLLTIYPFGDPHLGMRAWAEECGEDFDLEIAERDLVAAVDHLVDLAPPSREAIILPIGDTTHVDGKDNTTTAGTPQDVDTRYSKVFGVTLRALRRTIDRALTKHEIVRPIVIPGNHDTTTALVMSHCLASLYDREPRVIVDLSPAMTRWHRFGKCLFGFTHGDKIKAADLPGVMACDRAKDWGETEYRWWICGHVHHEIVKEFRGCTVEYLRTLAAKDAWHTNQGYRSLRDMKCDVYHREWGKIARHVVGIAQVRARKAA